MKEKSTDYSREIYEKFFDTDGRILKVTLTDGSVLEGIFVSFFHGDEEANEQYITKWHFIPEKEMAEYDKFARIDVTHEKGMIVYQRDIKSVAFKE